MAAVAVGSLLPSLRELLGQEYTLPTTVRGHVMFLLAELESIDVALHKIASVQGDLVDGVILWMKEETSLFYEILAILDNFQAHLRSMNPGPSSGLEGFIAKMKFKWANVRAVRQLARKISNAVHLQKEAHERRTRYRIDSQYLLMLHDQRDELGLENGVEIDLETAKRLSEIEDMYKMPSQVRDEIRFLKRDLESICITLRTIASAPVLDELTKAWAEDMKEVYCDVKNIVDNFHSIVADPPTGLKGFISMSNLKFKVRSAMAFRKFQAETRDMKSCLQEMGQRRQRYPLEFDVPRHTSKEVVNHRSPDLQQDLDSLVGLEGHRNMLVKLLTQDTSISTSCYGLKLASIVGVAGVGKTTLAKAVYHSLTPRFDCTAWVSVSSRTDIRSVLWNLLQQIRNQYGDDSDANEHQLVKMIRETVQNKRCFVVVDDIWDLAIWNPIKTSLESSNCCAVLQTSRITDLGRVAGGTVYKLEPLSENFSRQLFYMRLFGSEHKCPLELEAVSGDLLEKCSGIPLAIITTSNLLAGQKLTTEAWQAVHDSNYLAESSDRTKRILGPTYAGLSPYLKYCFLYLSMFKKGSVINVDRLIWGWITEGFVILQDGIEENPMTLREIGETYLCELINRNLIVRVGIDAVCVYNFLHELIVSLSAEENFAVILDGQQEKSLPDIVYRLSIQGNTPLLRGRLCHARSLVVFGDANLMPPISEFKDLRVLDLAGCRDTLQNNHLAGIGNSFFLKYLVIGGKHITDIPKEIGNLSFLQTLDLKESSVTELTESVFLLRHLKCLCVNGRTKVSTGIGKMESLEELGEINISTQELLEELCNLTKLRVLRMSIWSWDKSYSEALFGYLRSLFVNKQNMQSLAIKTTCSLHSLDKLNAETGQAPSLEKLEISQSTFNTVPTWIYSLQNLTSLSIEVYKLSQMEINMLGSLENLLALSLTSKHAPEGSFGKCSDEYRKLASFHFLSNAMGKIFGPGSMLKLERLKLFFQASQTKDDFEAFDFGLENLSTLQHAHVEINCFSATTQVVEDAEAAIRKTVNTEDLEIQRVRENDMLENEVLQCTENIKSSDENNNLAECADPNMPAAIPPEACAQPNADRSDEVSLLSQIMVDTMHLRLQLLNHDSKVKKMLSDINVKDSEIVQAARGRVEDLMKQVLNIGFGLSDEPGIVEPPVFYNKTKSSEQHERHIAADEQNSTIVKNVQESAGRESPSVLVNQNGFVSYDIPNPPQMESDETTHVSQETMCNGKDNQTITQINSCKPSKVLVQIEDVSIPKQIMEILDKEFAHDGPEKYLDDTLVNASIYCLRHKYPEDIRDGRKVFLENTETCQLLQRDGKHAMPKDSIEKSENLKRAIHYLNHDMIFLPLNWEQHWFLAVVSAKQHEIHLLDSMPSKNTEREELKLTLKGIEVCLELAAEEQTTKINSWSDFKVASWKVRLVEGLPKQEDSSSCGLFMLKYIEFWTGDRLSVNFTQEDITQFRRDLVSMLVNSPLNKINNNKITEGHES